MKKKYLYKYALKSLINSNWIESSHYYKNSYELIKAIEKGKEIIPSCTEFIKLHNKYLEIL